MISAQVPEKKCQGWDWKQYRQMTDPLADETIALIIANAQGNPFEETNALFEKLKANHYHFDETIPSYLKDYFEKWDELPADIDMNKVYKAESFFQQYGTMLSALLLLKSLPATYACGYGAEVLHRTGRLEEEGANLRPFVRRLMETAQFVLDIFTEEGFRSKGKALRNIQKVRLMHATVRHHLHHAPKHWDAEKLGQPINQQDMAGTLLSFSVFPLQGLMQIGIKPTEEEIESYIYVWQIVGRLMGVDEELIFKNFKSGSHMGISIIQDQRRESEAGKVLTATLVSFMEEVTPGNIFDDIPAVLINYLIGDELSTLIDLQVNKSKFDEKVPDILRASMSHFENAMEHRTKLNATVRAFSNQFLQGLLNYYNDHKKVAFNLPPTLYRPWQKEYANFQEWQKITAVHVPFTKKYIGIFKRDNGI
ncbi:oxygenase MpaB family protein [Persicobacter psychrovividus]|uniref:ER-bound oxygenase mpaB/mpaB'/Rubber oxygenase catalytic domain-containing protein n=1 Tax=Persicobacter psychrovividus TaxID=387638 RepID=A0ABN6LBT6_9BACT|nr:hypothetical protein PEPS_27370 [Persicobacter psychrovividus]